MSEPLSYTEWKAKKTEPLNYAEWQASQAQPEAAAQPNEQEKLAWSDVPGKAASNFLPSAGHMLSGIGSAIAHPIDTTLAVHSVASGLAQKILPESLQPDSRKQDRDNADAAIQFYKDRYGSEEGLKQAMANDPAGVMADASMLVTGGAGAAAKFPAMAEKAATVGKAGMALNPLYLPSKAVPVAASALEKLTMPFTGKANAARQISTELAGERLPSLAPNMLKDRGYPADFVGAPLPRFGGVDGINPTAGMLTTDPALLKLEQNARVRSPTGFYQRDLENTGQVYGTLESNALHKDPAQAMQDALNAQTTPMRDAAFSAAENNPLYRDALLNYVSDKAITPGIRGSVAMPMIDRAKRGLFMEPEQPGGRLASTAMPEDIYAIRKELADKLGSSNALATDEMSNAVKGNRVLASDMIAEIDGSLNASSGGAWGEYLKAHSDGMQPIEQGRSFDKILQAFSKKPTMLGTTTPEITPYALRSAAEKHTSKDLGRKTVSTIDDTARTKLDDAIDVMNSIERTKKGVVATSGSPTAPFTASLLKSGLQGATGSSIPGQAIGLLKALGVTRGQAVLDNALLNPEHLQGILDVLNKQQLRAANPITGNSTGLIGNLLYQADQQRKITN